MFEDAIESRTRSSVISPFSQAKNTAHQKVYKKNHNGILR